MIRRFARPYARAIMDIMQSPRDAQALGTELAAFEHARTAAPELAELYANPAIDNASKEAITRTIAQRQKLSDMAVKVLEVLIRNHRINDLAAILEALQSYVNEALNVAVADVRVAHELDAKERAELQQMLAQKVGRTVELRVTVDPTLLGGFVARIGSEIWDASVVGKINKFRTSLQ